MILQQLAEFMIEHIWAYHFKTVDMEKLRRNCRERMKIKVHILGVTKEDKKFL